MPLWLRIHLQVRERELSSLSPQVNRSLDLGSPEQVRLLRRLRRFWHHGSWAVHVIASHLMLGAVSTAIHEHAGLVGKMFGLTIAGMFHHSECVVSCTSCNLCETWCGCAWKDLHLGQPLYQMVKFKGYCRESRQVAQRVGWRKRS
jgi:hypothetical protein